MNISIPTSLATRLDSVGFTLLAIIGALLISFFARKLVGAFFRSFHSRKLIPEAYIGKTNTLNSVLFNVVDICIFVITLLIVLSHWHVDISPILTSAGILGLAISFGSQTLIKDIISGFFIISEGQYNVGDTVKIGTLAGKVTKITLRLTVLRDDDGNKIYIPNSSITTVTRVKVVKKSKILRGSKALFSGRNSRTDKSSERNVISRVGFHA